MAYVGPGHYVVVVLHVGGTKLSYVKLVLQREPRTGKTWFPAGPVTANEEHVNAAVRELHEETGLILTPDDLTLLSDAHVRVALPEGQQLVYVYSAYVHVPYVTTHLRTPAQLEQAVTAHSTINPEGSYVVPETQDAKPLAGHNGTRGAAQIAIRRKEPPPNLLATSKEEKERGMSRRGRHERPR
jgi:ADP-ribose pyrophosphatase YjhB (NUDIX family)